MSEKTLTFPGFVDVHVHFRDPGVPEAETTASGLAAAGRGGFAAVVTMPNTEPACDSPDRVRSAQCLVPSANKDDASSSALSTKHQALSTSIGTIFFNPEYGIRLGDPAELAPIYERIGTFLNEKCRGWMGALITGNPDLARLVNPYYKKRIPFYNGPIDCRLFLYEGCELKGQNVNGHE